METNGKCAVCDAECSLKCTACKCVSYCGIEHQKKDWKTHKLECRPLEIAHSDQLGRYVRASRDIKAKSVIFTESPLIAGPKWCMDDYEKQEPIFPCVGCFKPVRIDQLGCPRCNWPVCSTTCEGLENPQFHGLECTVLRAGRNIQDKSNLKLLLDYYRSDALLTLRCVLLQLKYPQKWKQLLELESHDEDRKGTKYFEDIDSNRNLFKTIQKSLMLFWLDTEAAEQISKVKNNFLVWYFREADQRIVSYLKTNFLDKINAESVKAQGKNLIPNCESQDLHRLCGIMEVNALNVNLPTGMEICAFYPTACLMEHSCMPNCFYTFDFTKHYKLTMIAGRDIKKGENLSIMYTHMLWGTQMRHEHLMTNKYFVCKCPRCADPTELGTFISALKCIGTEEDLVCGGTLLPTDPHDENAEWFCDRCPVRIANDQVKFLLSNIEEEVDSLMLERETTVKQLEDLVEKLKQFLHPNHYHIFSLKHSLIQRYGTQTGYLLADLSEELLKRKIDMCNELLSIVDVIDPHAIRLSLYTGIVLYELQLATVELERRRIKAAKENNEPYDYEELYNAEGYLRRAKTVLENNMDIPQGRKFVEAVVKSSENLEALFEQIKL